jgi:hypothetical protein
MANSTGASGSPNDSTPQIIELTDILDGGAAEDFSEEIIELTSVVDKNIEFGEDTIIIDLTDILPIQEKAQEEGNVLELNDLDNDNSAEKQKSFEEEGDEEFVEVGEDYVEVIDVPYDADEEPEQEKSPAMELDVEKIKELVRQEIEVQLADGYGDEDNTKNEIVVEPEIIEAAINKIVQEKFSDNIESVLFSIMGKVMEKEISEVKKNLQNDLDNITDIIKS